MCGIAGIASFDARPARMEELQAMCAAMTHRGPDEDGYFINRNVGLGMRRLRIIDLETGKQPVSNEDGSIKVILNGEIYNYRELRQELEKSGHRFRTRTDTETIAHLYEEYGNDCVSRLRGMFAFALWDERRQSLLLARDRVGIKPLYYTMCRGRFIFGSELKVVLQLPELERSINWQSAGRLFASLATPAGDSIISGIHKLEPGHILEVQRGRDLRPKKYWDVVFQPDYSHGEAYFAEQLRETLEEAVRLHLVSDVPLGAFLSGGLDSSAVVACMARQVTDPVRTFSIGFREQAYNEAMHAGRVARQFGTDHHEMIVSPNIEDLIENIAWYMDEPFGDSSSIPTYLVSKLASEQVTVVLSGDGGDELFAGYDKYRVEGKERARDHIPAALRSMIARVGAGMHEGARGKRFMQHLGLTGGVRYLDASTLFKPDQQAQLFMPDIAAAIADSDLMSYERQLLSDFEGDWLSALQYLDIKTYLPLDILTKVDRMSMAHSIEARVPLLDHKVIEFAATIPPEFKLKNGESKRIFKRAMRGILPDSIIDRRKHGFAVPLDHWFRGGWSTLVNDLLLSDRCLGRQIFRREYIHRLIGMHERGRNMDAQLWTMMSFELWCRAFLDNNMVQHKNTKSMPLDAVAAQS